MLIATAGLRWKKEGGSGEENNIKVKTGVGVIEFILLSVLRGTESKVASMLIRLLCSPADQQDNLIV